MRRRIHTQGDFDGACFLYAIANAYTALTNRRPRLEDWDSGIRQIPYAVDFLQGCVGTTQRHEKNHALLTETILTMLTELSARDSLIQAELQSDITDIVAISSLVTHNSVAILWYRGQTAFVDAGDHWVCAVAKNEEPFRLHVACSIRRSDDGHLNDRDYAEVHHSDLDRWSNDCITSKHGIEIMRGSVFKISIRE
ncbi:hypothetical protein ACFL1X_09690 [Candidatus Hydrogenedentota bacterium]